MPPSHRGSEGRTEDWGSGRKLTAGSGSRIEFLNSSACEQEEGGDQEGEGGWFGDYSEGDARLEQKICAAEERGEGVVVVGIEGGNKAESGCVGIQGVNGSFPLPLKRCSAVGNIAWESGEAKLEAASASFRILLYVDGCECEDRGRMSTRLRRKGNAFGVLEK